MPLVKFALTNRKHYPDLGSDASSVWISVLVSQTSHRGETVGGVTKCHLFSQATVMAENLVIILWPFLMGETNL